MVGAATKSLSPSAAKENRDQIIHDKMTREQEELRFLLEQKLRELQQSIEQESQEEHQAITTASCQSPSVSIHAPTPPL